MKTLYTKMWKTGVLALMSVIAIPADAQKVLPENAFPMIVVPQEQTISSSERTLCYNITANVPYEVSEDADWLRISKNEDGTIFVHATQNYYNEPRTAAITFTNSEKNITRTLQLTQKQDESVKELPTDTYIRPYSALDDNHQDISSNINATIDGDLGTIYHSRWNGKPVDEEHPATLTYVFNKVDHIDFINYVPRQNGNNNGHFGKVEIYIKQVGDTDFKLYQKVDWKMTGDIKTISFKDGLKNPAAIRFKVLTGRNNYASCAEMQFGVLPTYSKDFSIFADDVYSKLKNDVTAEDIENLTDPFVKSLAYKMYNGKYSTEYRVADYECFLSYITLSELWRAPGKHYDQIEGVTGINVAANTKNAVVVSGIPEGINVQLKVIAWYVGKIGNNFDGGNPHTSTFSLRNGINIIDYQFDYDGLAYICYYAENEPEKYSDIKVHFVNGQVNGYLSLDKTNEEMHEICQNAKNRCMDLYSKKVHQIWEAEALHKFCRSTDGKLGYRQFMNTADSLIVWEHRSLGFEKYNRIPKNHTMAYVNYTYYMFQGGFGVSFHMNQQARLMNCKNLIEKDNDAIWGLSHEWGHQHQMHPHFCWSGMTEVSNNMQSYYNLMKMGFRESAKIAGWPAARNKFLNEDYRVNAASEKRKAAYDNREHFKYSPKLYAAFEEMKDTIIPTAKENKLKALSYTEVGLNETLCPLIMLHNYFTATKGITDFMPDWYEALRQSDNEQGSTIEKQSGIDKYEILASCQNYNKDGKLTQLREKYPNSCWVKENYITEKNCNQNDNAVPYIMNFCRKVSRLSGYNLMPYFEQWGYLRQVALAVSDYGTKFYVLTEDMYNEFKEDMDALVQSGEIKEMPEGMVDEISNSKDWFQPRPNIAN